MYFTNIAKGILIVISSFYILFLFSSCDDDDQEKIEEELVELTPDSIVIFDVNDFHVSLNRTGELYEGSWQHEANFINVIYSAGLWLGLNQQGNSYANIVWGGSYPQGNYTTKWGDKDVGVYKITADSISNPNLDWPDDYGAPVDNYGNPILFGETMYWSALTSDTTANTTSMAVLSQPISGLRLTQALYGYQRSDLRNVFFIRYEITNLSSEDFDELYAGFYSDTDLPGASSNATGYDSLRALSYTYSSDTPVTGFTFLETPTEAGEPIGVLSHRILRKNYSSIPGFGEAELETPQEIIHALQGLSDIGDPMINPITGEETKFAFTGDPVNITGWLDTPMDVRSLLTSGPFTLESGESQVITMAWIVVEGGTLAESLQMLKSQTDQIRSEVELWQF